MIRNFDWLTGANYFCAMEFIAQELNLQMITFLVLSNILSRYLICVKFPTPTLILHYISFYNSFNNPNVTILLLFAYILIHLTYLLFNLNFHFFLDAVKGIVHEGMPIYKSPFDRGNLYIKFSVTFPENHFADPSTLKVSSFLCTFLNLYAQDLTKLSLCYSHTHNY